MRAVNEGSGIPEKQKANGTDGLNLNLGKSDAAVIPFEPDRRAGSSTVGSGARKRTWLLQSLASCELLA